MIKSITGVQNKVNAFAQKGMTSYNKIKNDAKMGGYTDSFVKHSKQSAPSFFAVSAIWAYMDKKTGKSTFKNALVNNVKNYMIPIVLVSSVILSFIENKNTKNNT